jgi:predicted ATPase/DNA-binding winged helix-turn-helix (wHTH) protein
MFRVRRGAVDLERRVLRTADGPVELTPIEVATLAHLHRTAGRVVTRQELLARVWGYAEASRSQAVHVAIRRLRAKLERDPANPEHLRTVAGVGWVLEVLPEDTGLVGRDDLLAEVSTRLDSPLVTLVGPGGIGKTSLARAVLTRQPGRFVDLSAATTTAELESAVAAALGVKEPTAVLARAGLVVLDNLEQLGDEAVGPIAGWLDAGARLLVTTRVRLPLAGAVIEVPPLAEADGVELLARRVGGEIRRDGLGPLATALEGNPLCLELAAPRLRVFTPEALLARLSDRFDLLRSRDPARPERQSALDASIAASVHLLEPPLRAALRALALFRAPFRPEAAEAVIGPGAVDALQELLDASLVHRAGERLALLVSVREWCEREDTPAEAALARHAAWFAATDPNRVEPTDLPDLVAATRWALGHGGPAAALAHIVGSASTRFEVPGAAGLLAEAASGATGAARVRLVRLRAMLLARTGRPEEALASLEGLDSDDPLQKGLTRESHGLVLHRLGRFPEAEVQLAAAEAIFAGATLGANQVTAGLNHAGTLRAQGRTDEARERIRAALALARSLGDVQLVAGATVNLAAVEPDPAVAAALNRDAIALFDRLGNHFAAGSARLNLAWARFLEGGVDEADTLATRALEALGPLDLAGRARARSIRGAVAGARGHPEQARGWLLEARLDAERARDARLVEALDEQLQRLG